MRTFAEKGATVIMHSGTGEACMPTANMVMAVSRRAGAGFRLNEKSGECLKREKYRAAGRRRQNPVFPPLPMAAEAVEEGNLLRFRRRAGICRASFDYRNFATVRLSGCGSKIAAFTELLVKVLIKTVLFLQAAVLRGRLLAECVC